MTRWERLLDVLGMTLDGFARESSAFDLNPKGWVEERIQAQLEADALEIDIPERLLEDAANEAAESGSLKIPCRQSCCIET